MRRLQLVLLPLSFTVVGAAYAGFGSQTAKLLPSVGGVSDLFGNRVAVDGTMAITGAESHDVGAETNAGAAFVFDTTTGAELAALLPNDGSIQDHFGHGVAIENNLAAVGAPLDDAGSVYLFEATSGTQLAKLVAADGSSGDRLGDTVDISGSLVIAGARASGVFGQYSGSAYLFHAPSASQLRKLTPLDGAAHDWFGISVAIDGPFAVVGAPHDDDLGNDSGSAYVFDTSTGNQLFKLLPSDGAAHDRFGFSVAVHGTTAVVGAMLNDNGGGTDAGAAYVFDVTTGAELHKLIADDGAADDNLGVSVSVHSATALVGAALSDPNGNLSGSAYLFDLGTGSQLTKLLPLDGAPHDRFGASVALGGSVAVCGAPYDDFFGSNSGSAYVFEAFAGPVTYCTAGTSASGCTALLSVSGTASASAPSGFTLSAAGVEGAKDGLFFFATSTRQANSWGNGSSYQCVAPPVHRAGLLTGSGSAGACDGSFAQDLNALWCPTCPKSHHNPGAGALVQAQLWYRDPASTSNRSTSLSDAVEFALAP
jgi:hypothetical protein